MYWGLGPIFKSRLVINPLHLQCENIFKIFYEINII